MDIIGDINPYLRAIGRLIVNFNALEHSLRRLAWILIDPQDDRTGQIVIDTLGTARIEELVKALLSHRIRDKELWTKLTTLMGQVAAVRGRRNDFAHAFWRVPNEAADLTEIEAAKPPTRKIDRYTPIEGSTSPNEIEAAATEAYQLGAELDELLSKAKDELSVSGGVR